MRNWVARLTFIGNGIGLAVIGLGLFRYLTQQSLASLLLAIAVVVVGPLEDLLQNIARRRLPTSEAVEEGERLIDRVTSITFLLLLLVAMLVP